MVWLLLLVHQMKNCLVKLGVKASLEQEFTRKQSRPISLHNLSIVQVSLTDMAAELARSQVPTHS